MTNLVGFAGKRNSFWNEKGFKEPLIKLQERSARDFVPNWGLEIAGILCVFQDFQTEKLGQKTRWAPLTIYSEVP